MLGLMKNLRSVRKLSQLVPKLTNTQSMAYSSGVEDSFQRAQQNLKKLSEEPGNEIKLKLYALYKQSTTGQCNTPKPSALNFVEKAKWGAWSALGSLSSAEAMEQYVNQVNQLIKQSGVNTNSTSGDNSPPNDSESELLVENRSGVCIITLNRPKKYNAITDGMYENIINALNTANADETIKLAVITGNGDFYSSGNDLSNFEKAFKQYKGDLKAGAAASAKMLQKFVAAFIDFQKPLIGAVNGPAFGITVTTLGLMDTVIISDSALFQTPFSSLGQSPEGCSTYTFPLIMGTSRASEMLYFNYKMSAKEALDCGFVSRIVPKGEFKAHIENYIFGENGIIKTCFPKSIQVSKALVRNEEMRMKLHQINKEECDAIVHRWLSEECMQALQKFFTRKPSNL